jgi:LuxR family maltose regulon positive regulatory protein
MDSMNDENNMSERDPISYPQSSPDRLFEAKLLVPLPSQSLVDRPSLIALLNVGLQRRFILVSAACGFGKTTLLSAWVRSFAPDDPQVAWVSLDVGDNLPAQFWRYVLTALDRSQPGGATLPFTFLDEEPQPAWQSMLSALINSIAQRNKRTVLVLDNYDKITEPTIHALISSLIEHLPLTLCVVLSTSIDPPFSLTRLRVWAQIQEIRAEQLRYSQEEAATFLRDVMGFQASEQDIQEVYTRTQGWWAGLQLAALALPGRTNLMDLLRELQGSQHAILEYLMHEVLQHQPPLVQTFLLRTSILERLSPSLCNALLEPQEHQPTLEELDHANLFLMPLDREHNWYAYYPLFAEALRYQLSQTFPDLIPTLHLQASQWYEAHHFESESIQHALSAQAWPRVTELIEHIPSQYIWSRLKVPFWIKQLPSDVVRARPRLCLAYAQASFWNVPPNITKGWLRDARAAWVVLHSREESSLGATPARESEAPTRLLGEIAALQAVVAGFYDGDAGTTRACCNEALTHLVEQQQAAHLQVVFAQSLADLSQGNFERAIQNMQAGSRLARTEGDAAVANISLSRASWDIFMTGRLHKTWRFIQHTLQLLQTPDGHLPATACWSHARQADILREWNRLEEAQHIINHAIQVGEQAEIRALLPHAYTVLLRLALSQGALEEAATANQLQESSWKVMPSSYRYVMYSYLEQIRFWLASGDLERAKYLIKDWEREEPLVSSLAQERLCIARARVWLAESQPDNVLALLTPLVERAKDTERWAHVLEMWVLLIQAYQMRQQQQEALAMLAQAVSLAAPEGYIRRFVDEGAPMADLLHELRKQKQQRGPTPYLDTLLAAFKDVREAPPMHLDSRTQLNPGQPLLDPLSVREHEVLQLIARGASNQEIAKTLVISIDTVRHHVSNILSKLEVTNRTQAVARAYALGL